jgi:hypothetical protein
MHFEATLQHLRLNESLKLKKIRLLKKLLGDVHKIRNALI